MSTVADLTDTTRIDGALRGMAAAADAIAALELRANQVFAAYVKAQERCRGERLTVDYSLSPGMAAALSAWKQGEARREGQEVVRSERWSR